MQRFVYFVFCLVLCLAASTSIQAQCTPLAEIPNGEIIDPLPFTEENPENGIRDTACADLSYETVIHINVPDTVDLGGLGQLPIDSISISDAGISGTPAGFAFDCNTSACVFYPNEISCIRIFGTPTTADVGMYNLEVAVTIHSGGFNLERSLPDPTIAPGEYRLFVREAGNAACTPSSIQEQSNEAFSLSLAPNPATDFTSLKVNAVNNGAGELRIFSATGQLMQRRTLNLLAGENQFRINTDDLPTGFYYLQLTNGRNGVSSRLLINH